ncbi:MAG: formate C-acetyltransferase [Bacilli bacterium]
MNAAWNGFKKGLWQDTVDVHDFIKLNYTEYTGDDKFLVGPTDASVKLNEMFIDLLAKEKENGGVLEIDTEVVSSVNSHGPGYLDASLEQIVGLQTDAPLKRGFHPFGGIKVAKKAAESYGFQINEKFDEIFSKYRKTHNDGVFDAYNDEILEARHSGVITGLPDAYGRGRIIGDYRRVALYGVDFLIKERQKDLAKLKYPFSEKVIRQREEISDQIRSLRGLIDLGHAYGFDLSRPATNAKEATQWLYLAYLGAVKEQNGAAMSLGRTSTFLDIYFERDLKAGLITEVEAQEIIDHFILKLRMVRFARTPEYNDLFTGDPTWVTESLAGMQSDQKTSYVTKSTFRYLHTLYNLGTSAEPNLTVLYSENLPENFKRYAARVSIDTSSIQFENDDLMRPKHGEDYAIACCVSPMAVGKEMQFFGARANLAKALLYSLNGGKDELSGHQVAPEGTVYEDDYLDYDQVMARYDQTLEWLAEVYVNTLNVIHYMHDKYAYEALEMALHDVDVIRNFATGVAGLSVVADSLSAIKYAKVKPIYDECGLIVDFKTEGDFPMYGNNDDRVDDIAVNLTKSFIAKLQKHTAYRDGVITMSVLTITSNVVYGKKTGNTPDGRRKGMPFAPGANPMHGRDRSGALNSLLSVAKLPFACCADGISNTFTIVPHALGKDELYSFDNALVVEPKVDNLVSIFDGYFNSGGHHLNVNVLLREKLLDAIENPSLYPNLTIRVSGYAVNFALLTDEQKRDVISRTFHDTI